MLLTNWKSIRKNSDNCSITTLKKWMRHYGFPIKMVGGKPTTTTEAIVKWWDDLPPGVMRTIMENGHMRGRSGVL